jgi:hypothetical protein
VALPAHPIGTGAAVAGVVEGSDANAIPAIASAVTMRITIMEMRRARKKSKACGTLLRIAFQSRRSHPVRTGGGVLARWMRLRRYIVSVAIRPSELLMSAGDFG